MYRLLDLCEEGVKLAREALGIYERFGNTARQGECLNHLASLFLWDKQLGATEEATFHTLRF